MLRWPCEEGDDMRQDLDLLTLFGFGEDVEVVNTGEYLFKEGDFGNCMYLVKSGQIDVKVGERLLGTFGPGEILGEMALIDQARRSANAVASANSEIISINEGRFHRLIEQHPGFALELLRTICRRLRTMNQLI